MKSIRGHLALGGNIRVLAVQTLISQLGFGMLYVVWQPYILSAGISVVRLGVIQSVISLSTAAGLVTWGALSDRVGRKPMLLASCAFSMATNLGFVLFHSFWAFVLFNVISALDPSFWVPSWVSLVSEKVSPSERSTALGKLDAYSRFAGMPAPYLAGVLYTAYGFEAPLLVLVGLSIVWCLMVIRLDTAPVQST